MDSWLVKVLDDNEEEEEEKDDLVFFMLWFITIVSNVWEKKIGWDVQVMVVLGERLYHEYIETMVISIHKRDEHWWDGSDPGTLNNQ